jgi:hypothetical protein
MVREISGARMQMAPGLEGGETGRQAVRLSLSAQRREGISPARPEDGSASGGTTPIHCLSVSVVITPQRPDFCK